MADGSRQVYGLCVDFLVGGLKNFAFHLINCSIGEWSPT